MADQNGQNGQNDKGNRSNWRGEGGGAREIEVVVCATRGPGPNGTEWAHSLFCEVSGDRSSEHGVAEGWDVHEANLGNLIAALAKIKSERAVIIISSVPPETALAVSAAITLRQRERAGMVTDADPGPLFSSPARMATLRPILDRHIVRVSLSPRKDLLEQTLRLLTSPTDDRRASEAPKIVFSTFECSTTGLNPNEDDVFDFAVRLCEFDPSTQAIKTLDTYATLNETKRAIPPELAAASGVSTEATTGMRPNPARIKAILEVSDFLVSSGLQLQKPFLDRFLRAQGIDRTPPLKCVSASIDWRALGVKGKGFPALCKLHHVRGGQRAEAASGAIAELLGKLAPSGKPYFNDLA
jgi:hypothetical protein